MNDDGEQGETVVIRSLVESEYPALLLRLAQAAGFNQRACAELKAKSQDEFCRMCTDPILLRAMTYLTHRAEPSQKREEDVSTRRVDR